MNEYGLDFSQNPSADYFLNRRSLHYYDNGNDTLFVFSPDLHKPTLNLNFALINLLNNFLSKNDGVFFHGAGSVINGFAFAILGVPESGKSTSIAMIEHDFLLSDDMLVMRFKNDIPVLFSTPLGPNTDGQGSAPLKVILYPVKSDHFELKPLTKLKAIEAYYHAQVGYSDKVFQPYRKMHFEKVCRLFSQVNAYEMHFTRDCIDNNAIRQVLQG